MKNRYEDPTARLHSHNWSKEYKDNYEKIFGKKETWLDRKAREEQEAKEKTNTEDWICYNCNQTNPFGDTVCKGCGSKMDEIKSNV